MVELAATVVGDNDSVRPEGEGEFGVLGVDDPFDDQVALPLVADGTDAGGGGISATSGVTGDLKG